jgi:hypothetical protein
LGYLRFEDDGRNKGGGRLLKKSWQVLEGER